MQTTFKILFIILLIISFCGLHTAHSQSLPTRLIITKQSNEKQKIYTPDSFFRLKTITGQKVQGKFSAFIENGIITQQNDTVLFQDIRWMRIQSELNKLEKGLAIAGVFLGLYLSIGTIPAGIYFLAVESTPWIMLAPTATISSFIIGFRTLSGKKYRTKKWEFRIH